jgi:hypothetical protein
MGPSSATQALRQECVPCVNTRPNVEVIEAKTVSGHLQQEREGGRRMKDSKRRREVGALMVRKRRQTQWIVKEGIVIGTNRVDMSRRDSSRGRN